MKEYQDLLSKFRDFLIKQGFSAKTIVAYCRDVKDYLRFCHSRLNASEETWKKQESILFYFSSLSNGREDQELESLKKRRNLKSSTISRIRAALVALSSYHQSIHGTIIFSKKHLKSPKIGQYIPHFYSESGMDEIIQCFHWKENRWELRDLCLVIFLYGTGLRAGELITLKPEQIRKNTEIHNIVGKGGKMRNAFLPSYAVEIFQYYLQSFKGLIEKKRALFFNKKEDILSYSGLYHIITRISQRHPTLQYNNYLHPHGFRHTFATVLLSNGADIRKIADLLGHSSLNTTQKYAHVSKELLQNTLRSFHPRFC